MKRWLHDESGATSIEYAMIAISIAVVLVAAITSIGASVKSAFLQVSSGFTTR